MSGINPLDRRDTIEAPGKAYLGGAEYMRDESNNGDNSPGYQVYPDSEGGDDTESNVPKFDATESKSCVQMLKVECNTLVSVVEQELGEVTACLEEFYTSTDTNLRENVSKEAIDRLCNIRELAYEFLNRANDIVACLIFKLNCLIFKLNNPSYPLAHLPPHLDPGSFPNPRSVPNQGLEANINAFPVSLEEVNLHRLHIPEAKRFIDLHLNNCVNYNTKRTQIICGWGENNKNNPGEGRLKKASKEYLDGRRGVTCEEVPRNRGRLTVWLNDDFDNSDLSKHMHESDDGGITSTSVDTSTTSNPSNELQLLDRVINPSPDLFIKSSGSNIPMSMLSATYGTDTGSWE